MPVQRFERITSTSIFVSICNNLTPDGCLRRTIRNKGQGKLRAWRCSFLRRISDLDYPAMGLTELINNRQPKAAASCHGAAGPVKAKERLEDLTALLLWDSRAIVDNHYCCRTNNQPHLAPMFDAIRNQIC